MRKRVLGITVSAVIACGLASAQPLGPGAMPDFYRLHRDTPAKYRRMIEAEPLPWPDALTTMLNGANQPRIDPPPSPWIENQQAVFSELLPANSYDVLVVPFQVQHFAIDRIGRSMMAADLAYALAAKGVRVPDPYVVARALGEGLRTLDANAVRALATRIGAGQVVWGYVGHDGADRMKLTIRVERLGAGESKPRQRDWRDLPFSDEKPPYAVFHGLLPEALEMVDAADARQAKKAAGAKSSIKPLPAVPKDFLPGGSGMLAQAARLELLGLLAPLRSGRAKERLFEKALLLLGPDPAAHRVLKARALLHLHRRPAALAMLGDDRSPAAAALRDVADGNLRTGLKRAAEVKDPLQRLMLGIELGDLAGTYRSGSGKESAKALASLRGAPPALRALLEGRIGDVDDWDVRNNAEVKRLLDADFPIAGFDLDTLARGQLVLGREVDLQERIDLAPAEHVRRVRAGRLHGVCCEPVGPGPTPGDYLDLLEAVAENNLLKEAGKKIYLQGLPDRGLELLDRYEPVYGGRPGFAILRTWAHSRLSERGEPSARSLHEKRRRTSVLAAAYWEQGQASASAMAIEYFAPSGSWSC